MKLNGLGVALTTPFKKSLEERRSISFNAKIDQSIYNVYE